MKRFLSAGVAGGSVIASYESDVVAWASEQASLIRAGRFELLDREHVAEEIESVARSEQRELASRMAVLLAHLLKWQYQMDKRRARWERTILAQRKEIAYGLHDTPQPRSQAPGSAMAGDGLGRGACPGCRGNRPRLFSRRLPVGDAGGPQRRVVTRHRGTQPSQVADLLLLQPNIPCETRALAL